MTFNSWMNSIADAGRDLLSRHSKDEKDIKSLCVNLCSNKGEAMGTALACAVVNAYAALDEDSQLVFFKLLVTDYGANPNEIIRCADVYKAETSEKNLTALSQAVQSRRQQLFRRINMSTTGTHTLVGMRSDLQRFLKRNEELRAVDADLKQILESWFSRGFLTIRSIDWKTPAHILEKLIAYEAVHEMNGWHDLRRRLADDRRCFAFFHPALEDEPLIFVEVALTNGLATAVQPLLAPKKFNTNEYAPDTAIFYSISNCQKGLRGISFGNFLIKQVVMELSAELPQLKQFSTLSPIPDFRHWLTKELDNEQSTILNATDRDALALLNDDSWQDDPLAVDILKPLLMTLCAHYLYHEKRGAAPLDPVARFHLGNGAHIEQLNWMGDISKKGFKQSGAILVNYLYQLKKVEANHEAFVNENIVAHSKSFSAQIKQR